MQKKSITTIDYYELEKLVQKHYGIDHNQYSFVATQECGNDSSHTFTADASDIADFEEEDLVKIRAGNVPTYSNGLIINDLCRAGVLEPGDYLVEVCW